MLAGVRMRETSPPFAAKLKPLVNSLSPLLLSISVTMNFGGK